MLILVVVVVKQMVLLELLLTVLDVPAMFIVGPTVALMRVGLMTVLDHSNLFRILLMRVSKIGRTIQITLTLLGRGAIRMLSYEQRQTHRVVHEMFIQGKTVQPMREGRTTVPRQVEEVLPELVVLPGGRAVVRRGRAELVRELRMQGRWFLTHLRV